MSDPNRTDVIEQWRVLHKSEPMTPRTKRAGDDLCHFVEHVLRVNEALMKRLPDKVREQIEWRP